MSDFADGVDENKSTGGKKFLWALNDADQMFGLFSTAAEALADAQRCLQEAPRPWKIELWDARPAAPSDAELFDVSEDVGGVDVAKSDWWVDCWVPNDPIGTFAVEDIGEGVIPIWESR